MAILMRNFMVRFLKLIGFLIVVHLIHMTENIECLQHVYRVASISVMLPNGDHTIAEQEGSVFLDGITLKRVLYVPSLNCSFDIAEHID
jgi:hypothetical protein